MRAWACGDIPLGFWTEYNGSAKERKDTLRAFLAAAQYHYESDCGGHHEVGPWEYEVEVRKGREWAPLAVKA